MSVNQKSLSQIVKSFLKKCANLESNYASASSEASPSPFTNPWSTAVMVCGCCDGCNAYLAELPWLGPAPPLCGPAARAAQWPRARRPSSRPGSPPGPYSTCPSSASAAAPPPAAGPPPRAAALYGQSFRH